MDIGEVVSDSFRYPSSDWKKVVVLGILFLLSFLIIPAFLVLGYVFRVLKASLAGLNELPEFEEWGEMFVDGIKVFVVYLIYFLPAIVIMAVSVMSIWSSMMSIMAMQTANTVPTTMMGLMGGSALAGMLISMIYMLVITPITVVAVANMAFNESNLHAAFDFSNILDLISQIGWVDLIIWYVVMIAIGIALSVVISILTAIPVIGGIILLLLINPYIYMFYARSAAWLYASAFENVENNIE